MFGVNLFLVLKTELRPIASYPVVNHTHPLPSIPRPAGALHTPFPPSCVQRHPHMPALSLFAAAAGWLC